MLLLPYTVTRYIEGNQSEKKMIKDKTFNENISVIEDIESCYFCHSFIKYNEETGENKTILIRSPEVTIFCKTSSDPPPSYFIIVLMSPENLIYPFDRTRNSWLFYFYELFSLLSTPNDWR